MPLQAKDASGMPRISLVFSGDPIIGLPNAWLKDMRIAQESGMARPVYFLCRIGQKSITDLDVVAGLLAQPPRRSR
jgi:hypothetical protein